MTLMVHEIFLSLQGETTRCGFPSVFVRLAGCNLSCRWCDTPASLAGGGAMSIDDVIERVASFPRPDHVTVTGGEPMCQRGALFLMKRLLDYGYTVQLETNGSMPLDEVPKGVQKIIDVKPPSSGHGDSFLEENLVHMGHDDELKIVIADNEDIGFAEDFIGKHLLNHPMVINLSPAGEMSPTRIAEFILNPQWTGAVCRLRLNLQVHKILNIP